MILVLYIPACIKLEEMSLGMRLALNPGFPFQIFSLQICETKSRKESLSLRLSTLCIGYGLPSCLASYPGSRVRGYFMSECDTVVLMFYYCSNNRISPNGATIIAKVLPANESLQILKVYSDAQFFSTLESRTQSENHRKPLWFSVWSCDYLFFMEDNLIK